VHPQQTRSRTLTVVVTNPGTNAHNCSLTSSSDHTTIYPLGHWYPKKSSYYLYQKGKIDQNVSYTMSLQNKSNCNVSE
jgi:hypothetical protein